MVLVDEGYSKCKPAEEELGCMMGRAEMPV